jgi:hypothetical protein
MYAAVKLRLDVDPDELRAILIAIHQERDHIARHSNFLMDGSPHYAPLVHVMGTRLIVHVPPCEPEAAARILAAVTK